MSDPAKHTLYDPEWQALRVSLLKKNQAKRAEGAGGGFTTVSGTQANIAKLRAYLGKNPSIDKLWRVLNLLNAVRMGNSGQKRALQDHDRLVLTYRNEVQKDYNLLKKAGKKFSPPSDETVMRELRLLTDAEFKAIWDNLSQRKKLHATSAHRKELFHFLQLMEDVKGDRDPGGK